MVRSTKRLAATAHHEAGHAVAAIVLGVPFKTVTIVPDKGENSAGHIHLPRWRMTIRTQEPSLKRMSKHAVMTLAGSAAQRKFAPRRVPRWQWEGDRMSVVELILRCCSGAENALFHAWHEHAREIADGRWAAIERVAAALLERKTLTEAEVRDLVAA